MNCRCRRPTIDQLGDRPFQILPGAAWSVSWCKVCGTVLDFVARNPFRNNPIEDQVSEAA